MYGFKWFLINEEKAYLGHKVGDVLTSVQDLEQDLGGMGVRQIARVSDDIVNQIRKILHGQWSPKQMKHLKELQKVAVALKKAIEEKDDLKELIPQLSQAIQSISTKLGVKNNNMQGLEQDPGPAAMPPDMQLTANGPEKQPPQQQGPPPPGGGAPPPPGGGMGGPPPGGDPMGGGGLPPPPGAPPMG